MLRAIALLVAGQAILLVGLWLAWPPLAPLVLGVELTVASLGSLVGEDQ